MKSRTINLSDIVTRAGDIFKSEKGRRIILIIGILGMLLILLSSYWPKKPKTELATIDETVALERYTQELESRLLEIIENISDVGKAKVMVTLETGLEYVYADEKQKSTGKTEDKSGNDSFRIQESNNIQEKPVIVNGGNGSKSALVKYTLQPKVKGVVVVCEGGDQTLVQQRVINAVTTALDISSARVCVVKSVK